MFFNGPHTATVNGVACPGTYTEELTLAEPKTNVELVRPTGAETRWSIKTTPFTNKASINFTLVFEGRFTPNDSTTPKTNTFKQRCTLWTPFLLVTNSLQPQSSLIYNIPLKGAKTTEDINMNTVTLKTEWNKSGQGDYFN